ncbi:MAG: hypothetical protein AAFY36_00590 [Bacteroidota bacterium]
MKKSPSYYKKRWLVQAPLSLSLIGFGVCLVSEAAMLKYGGAATWDWVLSGTLALVVLNSGLSLLGDSVLHRARYERLMEKE